MPSEIQVSWFVNCPTKLVSIENLANLKASSKAGLLTSAKVATKFQPV